MAPGGIVPALEDTERFQSQGSVWLDAQLLDARERGRLGAQRAGERLDPLGGSLDLDLHVTRRIQHPAGEPVPRGETVYKRAEAYPLYHAGHADAGGGERSDSGGRAHAAVRRPT